jgi:outer membrane beta-barrel protein
MVRIRLFLVTALGVPLLARGQEAAPAPENSEAEAVDVESIKKKYWATGDESQLGVVQNRLYSKAGKFQLGLSTGVSFSDPFLTMRPIGGSVGYFFNETWGLNLVAWKTQTSGSSALAALQAGGLDANTVLPTYYAGAEGVASILYGKLSFVGAKILYYDMYLTGGLGLTGVRYDIPNPVVPVDSPSEITYSLGLGQRFYVDQRFSVRLDYRFMYYEETIRMKIVTPRAGEVLNNRSNFTHSIQLGLDFFFGL